MSLVVAEQRNVGSLMTGSLDDIDMEENHGDAEISDKTAPTRHLYFLDDEELLVIRHLREEKQRQIEQELAVQRKREEEVARKKAIKERKRQKARERKELENIRAHMEKEEKRAELLTIGLDEEQPMAEKKPPEPQVAIVPEDWIRILSPHNHDGIYAIDERSDDPNRTQNNYAGIDKPSRVVSRARQEVRRLLTHWRNSRSATVWALLYIVANIVAFDWKVINYCNNRPDALAVFGYYVAFARGAANCLNLNCALILLPMCRLAMTKVRQFRTTRYLLPLDSTLPVHRVCGRAIVVLTTVHVLAHMGDFFSFSHADAEDIVTLMDGKLGIECEEDVPSTPSARWALLLQTRAAITGIIMALCMTGGLAGVVCQARFGYNVFWYSHHLFIVMLVALCFHGTGNLLEPFQSVYWICVPFALYAIPRIWRECRGQPSPLLGLEIRDDGLVAVLRLAKPDSWATKMKAGMYVNVNIPDLARFEWHPFSNSAAPSETFLEFHIRNVGDWTGELCRMAKGEHQFLDKSMTRNSSETNASYADEMGGTELTCASSRSKLTDMRVYIEGPIGASSQGFSDYRILVLCGAGVGVTPMISVIKDLLRDRRSVERIYFFWSFRHIAALEWFASLLDEAFYANAEECTRSRGDGSLFVIRLFLTSEKDKAEGQEAFVHRSKRSKSLPMEDSRVRKINPHYRVGYGRPRWLEEFSDIHKQARSWGHCEAGVFVCGPHQMANEVHRSTVKVSKKDPNFHFYCRKELFSSTCNP